MTLEVPGTGDVADRERYRAPATESGHRRARPRRPAGSISPAEAWELCIADAFRLDAMSDPVALAAQRIAERAFDQGVRISGLGGEIARGFYYVGKVQGPRLHPRGCRAACFLAMFVNEAVEPGLLTREFAAWARQVANEPGVRGAEGRRR